MKFIVTTTDMVSSPDYKSTGGLTMVTGVFETYMDARRSIQGFIVPDGRRLGFPTLIRKYGNMPKDIVWSDVAKSNRINPIISIFSSHNGRYILTISIIER